QTLPAGSLCVSTPGMASSFSRNHFRAVAQVGVKATRWAPSALPVRARSSLRSATVRAGSSAADMARDDTASLHWAKNPARIRRAALRYAARRSAAQPAGSSELEVAVVPAARSQRDV